MFLSLHDGDPAGTRAYLKLTVGQSEPHGNDSVRAANMLLPLDARL
jgi:hypothetical protein